MPPTPRSRAEMLTAIDARLVARTGEDVARWQYADRPALRPVLDAVPGRLLAARSLGNGACTVRVPLTEVAQVDVEVTDLLREADAANG